MAHNTDNMQTPALWHGLGQQLAEETPLIKTACANAWVYIGTISDYTIWQQGLIYQLTRTGLPPLTESGYYSLESLLQLKGLNLASAIRNR